MPRSAQRKIDFDDIVDAYFAAHAYEDAVKELRDYHLMRLAILEELFEFSLKEAPRPRHRAEVVRGGRPGMPPLRDREHVRRIARNCIEASSKIHLPFGVYLEGGPGPLEASLTKAHARRLQELGGELSRELRRTCAGAILKLDPSLAKKRFNEEALFRLGLPRTAPDPDDFW